MIGDKIYNRFRGYEELEILMKSKSLFLVGLAFLISALGGVTSFRSITRSVKADTSTTVTSNFIYDYTNSTYGSVSGDMRYLSDGKKNINDVPLTLWDGEAQDTNINFTYSGNDSSYAPSNYIRNKYDGYLQLHYPGIVNGDGGTIYISPTNLGYKITSITVILHSRCFSDKSAGESYNHIVVNDTSSYATIAEMGFTSSSPSKTWENTTDGISSFAFGISLKQSPAGDKEKLMMLSSISVTYVQVSDVSLVTFDTQGGSYVDNQYVLSGECATRPSPDPTKPTSGSTLYTFDDWYTTADGNTKFDFSTAIIEDTIIFAHWTESVAATITMSFESNGGTSVDSITTYEGSPFTKPVDPTRSSSNSDKYTFTFAGWFTDSDLKSAYDWTALASADIRLYAKWSFSVIDNTPSGRTHYQINKNADTWATTEYYTNDTFYQDVTLNSRETFETAGTKEEINIHILSNNSSCGFYIHKIWSVLVRNSTITITPADSTKVLTYVRFDFGNWGDNTQTMSLYPNDSSTASDTEYLPNSTETTHYLEASFQASDNVKFVTLTIGDHLVPMRNLYLCFAEDPVITSAREYATDFNDAKVCGTLDTDGLDKDQWDLEAEAFEGLAPAVQSYLTNYDGDDSEIVECLERYDRVIYLHGEDYDFMGRIEAGKVTPKANNINTLEMLSKDSNNLVVFAIAAISLLTIAGFFFVYKKRAID